MATVETLLTAEEFMRLDDGQLSELVRGRVVPLNVPYPQHGKVCGRIVHLLMNYLDDHDLGHVVCNDGGVITERGPDTVRGPDVSFYSYQRVPKGPLPRSYLPVSPELVFEVLSPDDRKGDVLIKVGEYVNAGVLAICVLDSSSKTMNVYYPDRQEQLLNENDELTLPHILGGFRIRVSRFFE
jgi:Uma2 family endonuclease